MYTLFNISIATCLLKCVIKIYALSDSKLANEPTVKLPYLGYSERGQLYKPPTRPVCICSERGKKTSRSLRARDKNSLS